MINSLTRTIKYRHDKKYEEDSQGLIDASDNNDGTIRIYSQLRHRVSCICLCRCILLTSLFIYLLFILTPIKSSHSFIPNDLESKTNFLLLVAHPDDECLFFSPTIIGLIARGKIGHLLVLSTGNGNGLGPIREKELNGSCQQLGIDLSRCLSLNITNLQDNPSHWWPKESISDIIEKYIEKFQIDLLITFDTNGISGHVNHRSISVGIKYYIDKSKRTPLIYELVTTSKLFKFSSVFDILRTTLKFLPRLLQNIFLSPNNERVLFVSSPFGYYQGLKAFHAHRSQVLWFRHLYTTFSRYMFINDLIKISRS